MKKVSLERALEKMIEGAEELQTALEQSPNEICSIFDNAWNINETLPDVNLKLQKIEQRFLESFRGIYYKTGFVVFTQNTKDHYIYHFCEVTYFKEGFDVIIEDTITYAQHGPKTHYSWEEFKESMIMVPEAAFELAFQANAMEIDVCHIAKEIIKKWENKQEELLEL